MVVSGDLLLEVDGIVVGGGGGGVARLAIALVVPCVHHWIGSSDANIRFYRTPTLCNKRYMEYAASLFIFLRMRSWMMC
jgi:hypothetical protein